MAVQRVLEGERPSVVIASYGFARPVIYRWLRDARGKGRGLRALRSRKGTGRPRRLVTLLQLKHGNAILIQALRDGQKGEAPRFISGMNPGSAPMSCRERHGA
jgi:hypothetical protein